MANENKHSNVRVIADSVRRSPPEYKHVRGSEQTPPTLKLRRAKAEKEGLPSAIPKGERQTQHQRTAGAFLFYRIALQSKLCTVYVKTKSPR